jgi:AraC-like DNA-binding protein
MYDHVRLYAKACAVLADHPALSLRQLARTLHVHPHTLAQIIREHTGTSFSAWRARHRLVAASGLLRSRPDLSIKEIAAATGFSSTSVFDRFVRRTCGCSPSHCRLAASSSLIPPAFSETHSAAPDLSEHPRTSPDGPGVNVLDRSSTNDRAQPVEGSGTLESCTASS